MGFRVQTALTVLWVSFHRVTVTCFQVSYRILMLTLCVLQLGLAAIQAAMPSELYRKTVLPNAPMPKAIKDILSPG